MYRIKLDKGGGCKLLLFTETRSPKILCCDIWRHFKHFGHFGSKISQPQQQSSIILHQILGSSLQSSQQQQAVQEPLNIVSNISTLSFVCTLQATESSRGESLRIIQIMTISTMIVIILYTKT